jgi:hypothetical protein
MFISALGRSGAGGDATRVIAPGVKGGEGVGEDVGELESELRDRAFPLLYTPWGTERLRNVGSRSMVGMCGRSAYVKYAVRCHLRGLELGCKRTQAE